MFDMDHLESAAEEAFVAQLPDLSEIAAPEEAARTLYQ
jgi:hypothetical protein